MDARALPSLSSERARRSSSNAVSIGFLKESVILAWGREGDKLTFKSRASSPNSTSGMGISSTKVFSNQIGKKRALAFPLALTSKREGRPDTALETRAPRDSKPHILASTKASAPRPEGSVMGFASLAWPITEPFTSRSAVASSSPTSTGAELFNTTSASTRRASSSEPTTRMEITRADTSTEEAKMWREPRTIKGAEIITASNIKRRLLNPLALA